MKGKKILAAALAAAMVLGSTVTAFAQTSIKADDNGALTGSDIPENGIDGSESGSGTMAGVVDRNVFHVVLPTQGSTEVKSALNFKLDPQKLVTSTSGSALLVNAGDSFAPDKTLFFPNYPDTGVTTGASIYWSDESSKFTVTNKGSLKVDVSASAELSNLGAIKVAKTEGFVEDTSTSMYMTILTDDNDTTGFVLKEDEKASDKKATASIDTYTIDAVASTNFEVKENNGTYTYELKENLDDSVFKTFSFWFKGASNPAGDWDALAEKALPAPKLEVTWNVKPHKDVPSITPTNQVYDRTSDLVIPVSLGSGDLAATGITKIAHSTTANGSYAEIVKDNTKWTYADGKLTFKKGQFSSAASGDTRYLKVTFNDAAKTSVILTVTIQ